MIISFGHNDGEWKSKYSFTPKSMMNSATELFSKADDVAIHVHNKGDINSFYDQVSSSAIAVAFNDNPSSNKIFKTISIEGSEPIASRLHNFAPKKSTDLPLQNNLVSTTEGQVRGGIIYHGLEKADALRNGASMHYVGDVSEISINSGGFAEVQVDNMSSDYIPTYDAVYGFYLPDTNEFYFGEAGDSIEVLDVCDLIAILSTVGAYNVSTQLDEDGVINSIVVSIPLVPSIDQSPLIAKAYQTGGSSFDGVLDESNDEVLSWVIDLPESVEERLGIWNVEIVGQTTNSAGTITTCPVPVGIVEILPPKPDDGGGDDGGGDDGGGDDPVVGCGSFSNGTNFSVVTSQGLDQTDGSVTVSFQSDIGVAPYRVLLENSGTVAYEAESSATGQISVTFNGIVDGAYRLYVIDSNPNDDDNIDVLGYSGCVFQGGNLLFFTKDPELECDPFMTDIAAQSSVTLEEVPAPYVNVTLDLSGLSQYDEFFDGNLVEYVTSNPEGTIQVTATQAASGLSEELFLASTNFQFINFSSDIGSESIALPGGNVQISVSVAGCPSVQIGEVFVPFPPSVDYTFGSEWDGRYVDFNYDGVVTTSDLLVLLSGFGQIITSVVYDSVYGVQPLNDNGDPLGDPNRDGTVSTADLLEFLTSFGQSDPDNLGTGQGSSSLKWPALGEDLENYIGPDGYINPTYFFDENGNPIPGAPNPSGYGVVVGSIEWQDQMSKAKTKSQNALVPFADLTAYSSIEPGLTPPQAGTWPAVQDNNTYWIQTFSDATDSYLINSLPANAQLYAFKNPEVYGDDLRGQTAEMLLDLGAEDFELFAVNLNYEPVNADHTR